MTVGRTGLQEQTRLEVEVQGTRVHTDYTPLVL
jgi:hypothetical protein